jgi:hypothetical protein
MLVGKGLPIIAVSKASVVHWLHARLQFIKHLEKREKIMVKENRTSE